MTCLAVGIASFAGTNTTTAQETKKVKMILDLDTGIDDAMALAYAVASPEIELIGVTTIFGNVTLETSSNNTLALLDLLNSSNVPVYPGCANAKGRPGLHVVDKDVEIYHGKNGIGNITIPASTRKPETKHAADFMIEAANKYGKDLIIVAVGPDTNLAEAIKRDPKLGEKVGKIVIMGGALIVEGNMNKYAEANIWNDPLAASDLFTSNTKFTMVGLDVTQRTNLTKEETQKWRALGTASGKAYADIVDFYIDAYAASEPDLAGCALHDPLAVAVSIHPEFVRTVTLNMKVGTDKNSSEWGRTVGDSGRMNLPDPNVSVCVDVKVKDFVDHFKQTLADLFSKN